MCIAIVKTKDGTITDAQLKNCWDRNKDGAGFAYPEDNKVIIEKGFFKYDDFLKRFREVEKKVNNNMLIHFRISTSGEIDKVNCHPHRINQKLAMIHNGILHIHVPAKSKVSDTVLYCRNYLQKLPKGFTHNKVIMHFIEENIGSFNKFCFLDSKGDYAICNEKEGEWVNGVWYSNTSYREPRYTTKFKIVPNKSGSTWDDDDYDYYYGRYWDDDGAYGFGSVKKFSKYAYLTDSERETLKESLELYDAITEEIDTYEDEDVLLIGRDPYVNLLTGELVSEEEFTKAYNQSRFMSLKEYDSGYDNSLYLLWGNLYATARAHFKEDTENAESDDVDTSTIAAYCTTCGAEFQLGEADLVKDDYDICEFCGGRLVAD